MGWFWQLSQTRQPAMSGVGPITYQEFVAWKRAYALMVTRFETTCIFVLDGWFRKAAQDAAERRQKKEAARAGKGRR